MKNISLQFLALMLVLSFSTCKDDELVVEPVLEVPKTQVLLTDSGDGVAVAINTNVKDWSATVKEPDTWCTVTPQQTQGENSLLIKAEKNTNMDARSTTITVIAAEMRATITVTQMGEGPAILVGKNEHQLSAGDTTIVVDVLSNVEYEIFFSSGWIQRSGLKLAAEYTESFHIDANESEEKRSAEILLKQVDGNVFATIVIHQARNTNYKPGDTDEIYSDIKVPVHSGVASSYQSGEGIEKSFDGDMSTIYHSSWNNTVFPVSLEYKFADAELIDYFIYYPRTSGTNGFFKEIEVWVSTAANPEYVKFGDYDFNASPSPSRVEFPQGLVQPLGIKIIVNTGHGDGNGFASCAEMEFYQKNEKNIITGIFTDETCSELLPDLTLEQITAISNSFYRNIAISMHYNDYPKEFRVQSYKPYPNPDVLAASNKTGTYSLLDNPTGICVEENDEVVVFVGDTYGRNISLRVMDFSQGYDGVSYALSQGVNKLQMSKKGLLYIMYHTSDPAANPVKIHIASGKINGYFDITRHGPADWTRLLSSTNSPYFDVLGEYAHMTFPVASFRSYCMDGARLVQIYDSISWLEQDFMGLYKYNRANRNRMYFHVVYGDSYMYATSYRTAYHEGTLNELCNPRSLRSSAIWGPAHEVGHINQTRPGFKWIGMTEVSNNVFSLYVQSSFGNRTRLQDENLGSWTNRYEKGFTTLVASQAIHGTHEDVFCKLIPFWQLQIYYSNVKGKTDFYKDVHERVRLQANPANNGEAQLSFIKICSDITGENLTRFFTAWGMLTPVDVTIEDYSTEQLTITQAQVDAVKKYMEQYPEPTQDFTYIYDDCIDVFKGNKSIVKGSASVSGRNFTFNDWQNVIVYEVYNSQNELVFVSPFQSFTVNTTVANPVVYAVAADGEKERIAF